MAPDPRGSAIGRPIGVLYIGAAWRSGSTLLDLMIGEAPGFVALGELRQLWEMGCIKDRQCGCGRAFSACPFWTAVGRRAFGGWSQVDAERMLALRRSLDSAAAVPKLFVVRGADRPAGATAYLDAMERVLRAVQEVSGAPVVVDSSKSPGQAMLLRRMPAVDLRLLHLVRDPRAVTFSRLRGISKRKSEGQVEDTRRVSVTAWAFRWLSYNGGIPRLFPRDAPRAFVRYEDLAVDPGPRVADALRMAGFEVPAENLAFIEGDTVRVRPNHMVYGNRMRFTQGELRIRLDEEWKRAMRPRDRRLTTAITLPLLRAYGYPTAAR
jgi:Sulfotransferase family